LYNKLIERVEKYQGYKFHRYEDGTIDLHGMFVSPLAIASFRKDYGLPDARTIKEDATDLRRQRQFPVGSRVSISVPHAENRTMYTDFDGTVKKHTGNYSIVVTDKGQTYKVLSHSLDHPEKDAEEIDPN